MSESLPVLTIEPYWAIEPEYARAAFDAIAGIDPTRMENALSRYDDEDDEDDRRRYRPYRIINGVAILSLSGPLTKRYSWFSWLFGGTSTIAFRKDLRQAAADPEVGAILLDVDSPGGTVDGTADLAEDVARIAKAKPVYGYVSDMACSAALWVISQATRVFANTTALIGSIGVYSIVRDSSLAYEKAGIKVHLVSTGPLKGAGVSGTHVTDAHLAEEQRQINALLDEFVGGLSRGRGMTEEDVRAIADGRVFVGREAIGVGLIDAVAPLDSVLGKAALLGGPWPAILAAESGEGVMNMSATTLWDQIKSKLGGGEETEPKAADRQISAGPSEAAMNAMNERLSALERENEKLKAKAKLGEEYEASIRKDAKAAAIRAYGPELGQKAAANVDKLDADIVAEMRDSWQQEADKKYGIGQDGAGASRTSAPAGVSKVAGNAEADREQPATGWGKLSEEQKRTMRMMNPDKAKTPEGREQLAYYVLNPDAAPTAISPLEE